MRGSPAANDSSGKEPLLDDDPPVDEALLDAADLAAAAQPAFAAVGYLGDLQAGLAGPGQQLLLHLAVVVGQLQALEAALPEGVVAGADVRVVGAGEEGVGVGQHLVAQPAGPGHAGGTALGPARG